jgi:hypothetical protein
MVLFHLRVAFFILLYSSRFYIFFSLPDQCGSALRAFLPVARLPRDMRGVKAALRTHTVTAWTCRIRSTHAAATTATATAGRRSFAILPGHCFHLLSVLL